MKNYLLRFFKERQFYLLFGLLLLIAITYSNSIYSPFILDDEHSFINESAVYLKDLSFESLSGLGQTKFGLGRLVPMVTFAVDHYLFAKTGSIIQYHITNILIHILTTLAVFIFIRGLFSTPKLSNRVNFFSPFYFSLTIAALWALAPVHTNAVTYVVQRMASLCAFFYISALACYVYGRLKTGHPRAIYFSGCIIMALGAMLSKENSATLPIIILLIEYAFFSTEKINTWLTRPKLHHWLLITLLFLAVLPLFEPLWIRIVNGYGHRNFDMLQRVLTESRILVFYLSLLLLPLPSRLNLDHDFPISVNILSPPETILSISLLICMLIFAFYIFRRDRLLGFGIIFFFITIFVESSFIPLELIFEHRLYLPSVGILVGLVCIIDRLLQLFLDKRNREHQLLVALLIIFVLALSSLATTFRNHVWRDRYSLASDMYAKSPEKPRVISLYGTQLFESGKTEEAIATLKKSINISRPKREDLMTAASNLILIYISEERYKEAIEVSKDVLTRENLYKYNLYGYDALFNNLSIALVKSDSLDAAQQALIKSLNMPHDGMINMKMVANLRTLVREIKFKGDFEGLTFEELTEDQKINITRVSNLQFAEIMIDIRKYDLARRYLKGIEYDNAVEILITRINNEVQKNQEHSDDLDLDKHIKERDNLFYRYGMKFSDFALTRYTPAIPLSIIILNTILTKEGMDHFAEYLYLKALYKQNRYAEALERAEKSIQQYPDFVPLLDLAVKIKLSFGMAEDVAKISEHILGIYPGHRKWQAYKLYLDEENE